MLVIFLAVKSCMKNYLQLLFIPTPQYNMPLRFFWERWKQTTNTVIEKHLLCPESDIYMVDIKNTKVQNVT